jgi:hypothetical protein
MVDKPTQFFNRIRAAQTDPVRRDVRGEPGLLKLVSAASQSFVWVEKAGVWVGPSAQGRRISLSIMVCGVVWCGVGSGVH